MSSPSVGEARERSVDLLHRGVVRTASGRTVGFAASATDPHYRAVWVRDAAVACLGADTTDDPALRETVAATLRTVAAATVDGAVPCVIWVDGDELRPDRGEAGCVDAGLWWIIALASHRRHEPAMVAELWGTVRAVLVRTAALDVDGSGLVSSTFATDWMDSSLSRDGKVLHVNALRAWAASEAASMAIEHGLTGPTSAEVDELAATVRGWFWPTDGFEPVLGLAHPATPAAYRAALRADRSWFVSHIVHAAFADACDVLANLVAVLGPVADDHQAQAVLDACAEAIDPYPTRTWLEPVGPDDPWRRWNRPAEAHIPERWRNPPGRYHNGAVWPYVGGLHAVALARRGRRADAEVVLDGTVAANALEGWSFPEWIAHPDATPEGARRQLWNAGALLLAIDALGI